MKRQARIHRGKRSWYTGPTGCSNWPGAFYQRACFYDIRPWYTVPLWDITRQVQMRIEKWREGVGYL